MKQPPRSLSAWLFLARRHAVAGKLALGALARAGLLAQRFPANLILARLTDAAVEDVGRFSADHALLFAGFTHARILVSSKTALAKAQPEFAVEPIFN